MMTMMTDECEKESGCATGVQEREITMALCAQGPCQVPFWIFALTTPTAYPIPCPMLHAWSIRSVTTHSLSAYPFTITTTISAQPSWLAILYMLYHNHPMDPIHFPNPCASRGLLFRVAMRWLTLELTNPSPLAFFFVG